MSSAGIINYKYNTCESHVPYINSCESIVIDWWRRQSPRNYSLVINKSYNSSRRHFFIVSFNINKFWNSQQKQTLKFVLYLFCIYFLLICFWGGDWLSGQCVWPLSTSTPFRDVVSTVRYLSRLRLESNGKLLSV